MVRFLKKPHFQTLLLIFPHVHESGDREWKREAERIVEKFGVPMVTVKRYMKVYRQHGAKGFYETKPRHSSASKLKGKALERAQQLLDDGRSVPEVAEEINVLANTIHKGIWTDACAGRAVVNDVVSSGSLILRLEALLKDGVELMKTFFNLAGDLGPSAVF